MNERQEKCLEMLEGNLRGRDYLEDIGIDKRILLEGG